MLEIGDTVRLERKQERGNAWEEVGKGVVQEILYSGRTQVAIKYRDREWIRNGSLVSEIVTISSSRFKVTKWSGKI